MDGLLDDFLDIEVTLVGDDAFCIVVHFPFAVGNMLLKMREELLVNLKLLQDFDCDMIQGYYFSKPLPEEDFVKLLKG